MLGWAKKSKSVPAFRLRLGKSCWKNEVIKVACSRNKHPAGLLNIGSPALPKLVERTVLLDRKSTRLNSSHPSISYAVFCLKKKKHTNAQPTQQHSRKRVLTHLIVMSRDLVRCSISHVFNAYATHSTSPIRCHQYSRSTLLS